jgi:hypothetical protein
MSLQRCEQKGPIGSSFGLVVFPQIGHFVFMNRQCESTLRNWQPTVRSVTVRPNLMNRRLLVSLLLLGALCFSGCSDQARYDRYVRASVRAKEKRQKQWRKEMEIQNREQLEALQDAESMPPSVTMQ